METPRKSSYWRSRSGRVLRWLLVLEIVWLGLVNGLLWLPVTQQVISAVRPEKLAVRWDRAWTLAPFHAEVRGLFANGNARRQMWQVEAASVSGWVNPVPLVWKQVSLHAVAGRDVDYRQRPRPQADRDYSAIEAWFPGIEGREVTPADLSPYRSKRPWRVVLDEVEVGGRFDYWVYQLRGAARGRLSGDLDYRTRGGPLRFDLNELDLEFDRHVVNGEHVVFDEGRAQGALGFAPFRPREDRGVALLRALHFDLDVDADLGSLAFLDVFLLNFRDFRVDGSGEVVGRLNYDRGVVQPGTDLAVAARNLEVGLMGHRIEGMGTVGLRMDKGAAGQMELSFYFGDLRVLHDRDGAELLTGQGLMLTVGGDGAVLPDPDEINESRFVELDIGPLAAPDFAVFQRYLPERWPFRLHGGRGTLAGTVEIRPTAYAIDLALESDEADLGVADYRFLADLDAGLKLGNPSLTTGGAQADGSYLRIEDARLRRDDGVSDESWSADFELLRGRLDLLARRRAAEHDVIDMFRILADEPIRALLADANGAFDFRGQVSELAWLGVFFGDGYRTRTAGSAQLEGTARLEAGLPAPGTDIALHSEALVFNILDYASRGRGKIRLAVEEGGENADWRIALDLEDADLRRRQDRATFIEDVQINVEARIEDVDFDVEDPDYELTFRMPAGRVTDMATFNRYLPPDAPIALIGGDATLASELTLKPDDADGWVRLDAEQVDLAIDGQEVQGDLQVEIAVIGGRPEEMIFDIAGSRMRLDGVRVRGDETDFGDDAWFAELVLTRGDTVFENPLRLDVDAELRASDSRPLVTLFRNQKGWRPEFIARALTVTDITGNAQIEMADERLRIPYAWLNGEAIEAGAKAELTGEGNRGIVYLKFRDLDALLRIADGKRNLDILRARKKFDEYRVGAD